MIDKAPMRANCVTKYSRNFPRILLRILALTDFRGIVISYVEIGAIKILTAT